MSKSTFKSIQNKIFPLESNMGYGFQIRGDHHKGVVNVAYDENSGPNRIAGLAYVNKPKNHFSFSINPQIKDAYFKDEAQAVIANNLLSKMKEDAKKNDRKSIILFPSSGHEKNTPFIIEAMQKNAEAMGVTVAPQEVQIDKTHKVPGIALTFA